MFQRHPQLIPIHHTCAINKGYYRSLRPEVWDSSFPMEPSTGTLGGVGFHGLVGCEPLVQSRWHRNFQLLNCLSHACRRATVTVSVNDYRSSIIHANALALSSWLLASLSLTYYLLPEPHHSLISYVVVPPLFAMYLSSRRFHNTPSIRRFHGIQ